ncbi:sulfite exporter TauE/SafE family protein [Christensenellaceae bacterium OttesenSCG-928-M15]|nr:sulfite exporter TauE/SafE family protein [Christensenellaceae bacterium OttesenSCG-928-M15]
MYPKTFHTENMKKEKKIGAALFVAAAIGTGVINGLFGAGGGMIAVVVLERLKGLETQRAHATALMVMLPLSIISIVVYFLRNAIVLDNIWFVALGMLPGSLIGAKLLGKLKTVWVDRLFCILMLAAGLRLVV